MNTFIPVAIGAFVLCGMPLLSFLAGMWYAKHGSPLQVRWRGFRSESDLSEELD